MGQKTSSIAQVMEISGQTVSNFCSIVSFAVHTREISREKVSKYEREGWHKGRYTVLRLYGTGHEPVKTWTRWCGTNIPRDRD